MLRNEERLYQIFVKFPVVCDKQFLILKIKRNEAICCLIGFGIGISCCLMYRWFTSSLNCINKIESKIVDEDIRNVKPIQLKPFKSSRKTKSQYDFKTPSSSASSSSIQSRAKSQVTDFEDPLNDVYNNLTKFLSKQFCRNIKMRKPVKKKRHTFIDMKNSVIEQPNSFGMQQLVKSSSATLPSNANTSFSNNQYFNTTFHSSSSSNQGIFDSTNVNNQKPTKLCMKKMNSISQLENEVVLKYNSSDEDVLSTHSHISSMFDFDEFPDARFFNSKSDMNTVDKTLDEALNQINQLKEDMSGLCNDLDTLYNTKADKEQATCSSSKQASSLKLKSNRNLKSSMITNGCSSKRKRKASASLSPRNYFLI